MGRDHGVKVFDQGQSSTTFMNTLKLVSYAKQNKALGQVILSHLIQCGVLLFSKMDANVVAVHWPKGADGSNYFKAARNTELIGRQVGNFLDVAMGMGITPDMIHLVGHSLGSQICNFAVNWLRQVSVIAPGFTPARISG